MAAEYELDVRDLGYRRDRVNAMAASLRLAHTVDRSEWFTR